MRSCNGGANGGMEGERSSMGEERGGGKVIKKGKKGHLDAHVIGHL